MLDRIDIRILRWNRILLIVILGVMSALVFANVVSRFVLTESIVWAEEVSRHLMIWLTFLGSGLVLRFGGHIAVDNLQDFLPRVAAVVLRMGIVLILLIFFATMTIVGFQYVAFQWQQTTPVTQIPFGFVYAALPVGFLLMIYHLAMVARRWIVGRNFDGDAEFGAEMSSAL